MREANGSCQSPTTVDSPSEEFREGRRARARAHVKVTASFRVRSSCAKCAQFVIGVKMIAKERYGL